MKKLDGPTFKKGKNKMDLAEQVAPTSGIQRDFGATRLVRLVRLSEQLPWAHAAHSQ